MTMTSLIVPGCALVRATLDDFAELQRIHRAAMYPSVSVAVGWDDQVQADRLRRHWHDASFFLRKDDATVGFVSLFERDHAIHLERLYILPDRQGQGLGSGVLAGAARIADCRGLPVRLTCLKKSPARAFYEARGFEKDGEDPWQDHLIRPVPYAARRHAL